MLKTLVISLLTELGCKTLCHKGIDSVVGGIGLRLVFTACELIYLSSNIFMKLMLQQF